MNPKPIAFITGATSGIGEATATILSKKYQLILCGRRTERLKTLSKKLDTPTHILSFDISKRKEVIDSLESLPLAWQNISILINNAGNAHGLSTIQEGDIDDWEAMIDINLKGLLYVSKMIIPTMIKNGKGHIINIGSIAGKEVYPKGNVYCASKFAVDALNKAMRIDLIGTGIRIGAINPGLVATEFSEVRFKGDKKRATQTYQGYQPLQARDIAHIIDFVLSCPPHVNIADLLVLPTAQASCTLLDRKTNE